MLMGNMKSIKLCILYKKEFVNTNINSGDTAYYLRGNLWFWRFRSKNIIYFEN